MTVEEAIKRLSAFKMQAPIEFKQDGRYCETDLMLDMAADGAHLVVIVVEESEDQ